MDLDSQQSGWGLRDQSCDRPFRMDEAVLVAQVVGEMARRSLKKAHTLFLW